MHYVFLCEKEEKDELKKTEGGTEIMMSCHDFEPGTPCSPTTGLQATEDKRRNLSDYVGGYMRVYSVTSSILVSCPLA